MTFTRANANINPKALERDTALVNDFEAWLLSGHATEFNISVDGVVPMAITGAAVPQINGGDEVQALRDEINRLEAEKAAAIAEKSAAEKAAAIATAARLEAEKSARPEAAGAGKSDVVAVQEAVQKSLAEAMKSMQLETERQRSEAESLRKEEKAEAERLRKEEKAEADRQRKEELAAIKAENLRLQNEAAAKSAEENEATKKAINDLSASIAKIAVETPKSTTEETKEDPAVEPKKEDADGAPASDKGVVSIPTTKKEDTTVDEAPASDKGVPKEDAASAVSVRVEKSRSKKRKNSSDSETETHPVITELRKMGNWVVGKRMTKWASDIIAGEKSP
jgi:hypothetical protein